VTPRDAGRIARRFGVMLFDGDRAGLAPVCALVPPGCSPLVAHRRCDTPAELRARCRWASKRAAQQHQQHHRDEGVS